MTSSPSTSEAFAQLHPEVQRWVWDQQWTELRDAQEAAIGPISDRRDVIVAAATASGKTEAAFLPIGSALASSPRGGLRVLVVSPLKALINDQFDRLDLFFERLGIATHRWHGDVPASRKQKLVREPSGVLLITPESLEALFVVHGPRLAYVFAGLEWIVVDELHAFIGSERGRQLQSLAHRIEAVAGRRIPRVGLSATLGDMTIAADFLRPGHGDDVVVVRSAGGGQEVRLQLRGYVDDPQVSIAEHVLATLRGTDNLVFANRRTDVELYADLLRRLSERAMVPNEFWPHHGSLSREIREDVERMLKERAQPVTAVCTTTLELGIDIGSMASVAQIGSPPSVSALRQRLGRSGRRGEAAVMRMYVHEEPLDERSPLVDRLRAELVEAVAMVRLLAAGWVEPPASGRLHLSTLVQQVLSLIAERGGVGVAAAYDLLRGAFDVPRELFAALLAALAAEDLVETARDGTLLLGIRGERLVNNRAFYVAFSTPEEYTLESEGRTIGSLPLDHPVHDGAHLIFAGRRWQVVRVDAERRHIDLIPASAGRAPRFTGPVEPVHDRVREEMVAVYGAAEVPVFLDAVARSLLEEARETFRAMRLDRRRIVDAGKHSILLPWFGDIVCDTIVLLLRSTGCAASAEPPCVMVQNVPEGAVREVLREIASSAPSALELARGVANTRANRYDHYLTDELAAADYAARAIDVPGALRAIERMLE